MSTEWVEIENVLLSEALRVSDPIERPSWTLMRRTEIADYRAEMEKHPERGDSQPVPKALVASLIEYLSDDLGCDHSVNICNCEVAAIVYELELQLTGKRTCAGCSGEGFNYSEELHRSKLLQLEPGSQWFDYDHESLGYQTCLRCEGSGVIAS